MSDVTPAPKTAGLAVSSIIFGILTIACMPILFLLPAIICGHLAHSKINASNGALGGKGIATAGLVLGYIGIPFSLLFIAILLPAISNATQRGHLTALAANGRSIQQSVAVFGPEDFGKEDTPWPKSADFKSSEEYFVHLVESGVMNVGYDFFSGPGLPKAQTKEEFLQGGYNAWCVVADLNDASLETLPFLFSRNLKIQNLNDPALYRGSAKSDALAPAGDSLFGDKGMTFVTKAGSAYALFKDDLAPGTSQAPGAFRTLFNVELLTQEEAADQKILRPIGH